MSSDETVEAMTYNIVPMTLLVGNPRRASRTLGVAWEAAGLIRAGLSGFGVRVAEPDLVDLADVGSRFSVDLGDGVNDGGQVELALARIRTPGLLIVASPTFNGSYTGLLKLFMDRLPRRGLADTVALALMTAAWSQHRYVADSHLRALLLELGATVPVPALSVIESEFPQLEEVVGRWSCAGLPVLAAVLRHAVSGHGELVSSAGAGSTAAR